MATPETSSSEGKSKAYSNISLSGNTRAHLGDAYYSGSINISQSDLFALTGPLNITIAFQGLTLISTRLSLELKSASTSSSHGQLRSAILAFRDVLRKLLPTSILASMSPSRAALVPAMDLILTISAAVLLFSELEEYVGFSLGEHKSDVRPTEALAEEECNGLVSRLSTLNSILGQYIQILQCDTDADAIERATAVHRMVEGNFGQRQPESVLNAILDDSLVCSPGVTETASGLTSLTSGNDINAVKPEFAHLVDVPCGHYGPGGNNATAKTSWKRQFEEELFRTAVYSRGAQNSESVSDLNSTIGTPARSILSYLTLAEVSIVSVLNLPVQLEDLVNRSAYTDGLIAEPDSNHDGLQFIQFSGEHLEIAQRRRDFILRTNIPHPAHNYAQEIALDLGIPMHATYDQFVTAVLEYAQLTEMRSCYTLYIEIDSGSGGYESTVAEEESPLLLHARLTLQGYQASFIFKDIRPEQEQTDPSLVIRTRQAMGLRRELTSSAYLKDRMRRYLAFVGLKEEP